MPESEAWRDDEDGDEPGLWCHESDWRPVAEPELEACACPRQDEEDE